MSRQSGNMRFVSVLQVRVLVLVERETKGVVLFTCSYLPVQVPGDCH